MRYTFISGATGGIGKAFVYASAKRGYNLFLTGRSIEKLTALKDAVEKQYGVEVLIYPSDLTSEKERKAMLSFIGEREITFDRILLVAGVDIQKAFKKYTEEKVLFQIRVNTEATIHLTHQLLSRIDGVAEIVVISSMSGVSPMPYFALYSASKCMLTNFYTALHYELKGDNVKITTVIPGGVYTRPDVIKDIKGQGLWGKLSSKTPEYIAEKSLKAVKKNKVKFVPGFFNRFLYCVMKIAPQKIVLQFIANRWKKQEKDAF